MSDNIIVELLKELRAESKKHTETLVEVKSDVRQNKDDLQEHMAQTRAVRSLVQSHEKEWKPRLDRLEEPRKVLAYIKKGILGLGGLAGTIYGFLKLLEHF